MTDTVVVALITAAGSALAGALGKSGYDRLIVRYPKHTNGNGGVETVIARRAEIEFQTRITLLLDQLTSAIEKGQERSAEALQQAANAIREVHQEIVSHKELTNETYKIVHEINKELAKRRTA